MVVATTDGFAQKQQFSVEVTAPTPNSQVGKETVVKGTAVLPAGQYLWVLSRRSDFTPFWWPQREAQVDPKTHEWSTSAFFGGPQDKDHQFDIGVITVDANGHAILKDYWLNAMRTGDWKPIEIPTPSSPPHVIKVNKVSH